MLFGTIWNCSSFVFTLRRRKYQQVYSASEGLDFWNTNEEYLLYLNQGGTEGGMSQNGGDGMRRREIAIQPKGCVVFGGSS